MIGDVEEHEGPAEHDSGVVDGVGDDQRVQEDLSHQQTLGEIGRKNVISHLRFVKQEILKQYIPCRIVLFMILQVPLEV